VRQGGKAESNKLAVRVHEVDGAHDHLLDLEEDLFGTDLPCYSRLRKNRRKKGQPGEGPEVTNIVSRALRPRRALTCGGVA
jgi:hypothetical protein